MSAPPFRVKAVYDYTSPHDDDLKFANGQIITVTQVEDEDWYFGEYTDASGTKEEGIFPRNFVERYEPGTPPRPTRPSRPKKEADSTPAVASPPPVEGSRNKPEQDEPRREATLSPAATQPAVAAVEQSEVRSTDNKPVPAQGSTSPTEQSQTATTTNLPTKPAPQASSKPPPPAVTEKPTGGSFRDRIAAFNKPAAPPIAPPKPGGATAPGGSSFIKKPFIAPPPSRDAYVPPAREHPPQRVYRREEDPSLAEGTSHDAESLERSAPPPPATAAEEENQPKPTSLKDRIALLQKQQMEQAARHAEAVQKKEKPKRPPKKRMESQEGVDTANTEMGEGELEWVDSGNTVGKRSVDAKREHGMPPTRSSTKRSLNRDGEPRTGSGGGFKEPFSDANDADQSGAGDTEDAGDYSTEKDDSDEKPNAKTHALLPIGTQEPIHDGEGGDKNDKAHGEEEQEQNEDDEEDEVDPEVRRRLEIRERMAKMSGGMGMAGMFGPPGAMPMPGIGGPRMQKGSGSSERKMASSQGPQETDPPSTTGRAPPVPMMPMLGMQKVRSPDQVDRQLEVERDDTLATPPISQSRTPDDVADVEDLKSEPSLPSQDPEVENPRSPSMPQGVSDRPVPLPPPVQERGPPPPAPGDRPIPPLPPPQSRPVPPPPASTALSPITGSDADNEMSLRRKRLSLEVPTSEEPSVTSRTASPYVALEGDRSVPNKAAEPRSPEAIHAKRRSYIGSSTTSPTSPTTPGSSNKRTSRVPPIPGSSPAMEPPSRTRAVPPPPPTAAPPRRKSMDKDNAYDAGVNRSSDNDSEEEVTAYEGDYDTDMASGASHKDALKSHARDSSAADSTIMDEPSVQLPRNPPMSGPPPLPPSSPPRAVPPLPPALPPKSSRRSTELPRAVPPVPASKEPWINPNQDYDPYRHVEFQHGPLQGSLQAPLDAHATLPGQLDDDDDDLYSAPPPRRSMPPPPPAPSEQREHPSPQPPSQFTSSPNPPGSSRTAPRQSLDVQRMPTSARRSMEQPRPLGEHGFIATHVELAPDSQWWAQPNTPPPVFQNRKDIIYEVEETTSSKRGGKTTITKDVYVLFIDYSQTIITARFDPTDPADANLEQRYEPPPPPPRQDQLETAHSQFGARISKAAESKQNSVVGDGSPHALVIDLFAPLSDALLPVGTRAYGALVYANLANASVTQLDEIRPGDIVSFRNARFQGHRGTMHQKYAVDVGKPDHVAVVVDWDGTKKKVRAWEQGRESRKVKMESFKLGDLRSGEVKVWRVMARAWVGWEGQN